MRLFSVLCLTLLWLAGVSTATLGFERNSKRMLAKNAAAALASRQMTRQKLTDLTRRKSKIARGILRPRASAVAYPACTVKTDAGYARFSGYNYWGHDINSTGIAALSEAVCLDTCKSTAGCIGIYYEVAHDPPCWLKKDTVTDNTALFAYNPGTTPPATSLQGSCASLASYYSATAMAACCDSVDAYPQCPIATIAGYAHFTDWNYNGDDIAGNPLTYATETGCMNKCSSTSGCVGVFYWPSQQGCYLKNKNFDNSIFEVFNGTATDLQGTCNLAAASGVGPGPMADCCNSHA